MTIEENRIAFIHELSTTKIPKITGQMISGKTHHGNFALCACGIALIAKGLTPDDIVREYYANTIDLYNEVGEFLGVDFKFIYSQNDDFRGETFPDLAVRLKRHWGIE